MTRRPNYHPLAERELKEAILWYSKQKKGLGKKFAATVRRQIRTIQKTPKMHAVVFQDIRKAVVKGFPYIILYRVIAEGIVIISVFHAKRDPSEWQRRV